MLDPHLDLLDADIPSKYFVCLHVCLQDVFNTCLQDIFNACLQDVFSIIIFHHQDVLENVKLLHRRRLENVFKTSWRHLEDVFKTSKCFLGINSWKYRDIEETNYFCWKLPNPGQDKYQSPTDLFVLLFNDKILDQVWRETNKYASQKGNYLLNLDKQHLQPFIAVLILSIYIDLLQRPMYWKWQRVLKIALEKIQ